MTLADALEARFRRELAEARKTLNASAPFYAAYSLTRWWKEERPGEAEAHPESPDPLPALWRKADGRLEPFGAASETERPASCGEVLELLEKRAPNVAEREARAMTLAGELLVSDAEERAAILACAAEVWPWTAVGGDDEIPRIVSNLMALAFLNGGEGEEGLYTSASTWAPVGLSDAIGWIAEGLERHKAGAGARYRAEAKRYSFGGEMPVAIDANGKARGVGVYAGRDWFSPEGSPESIVLGTLPDLVNGPQLSWLYWASLPPGVRHAQALWRDVGRLARGDLRRLLEHTAPAALHEEKEESTREARGELATATLRHVMTLHERLGLDTPPPATEAEALERVGALSKGFADYVAPMGDGGKKLASSVRESSAARANANADERWKLWRSEPGREPRWLVELAVVVWRHEAKRDLAKRTRTPVGAALPVARLVASALQRGTTVQHNEARQLDILLDRNDHVIATFDTGPTTAGFTLAALDRLREEVELLATIDAYALLHFLAAQAREHHVSSGNFMVEVEGGWTGLARLLGVRESDSHERLRDILDLLQRLRGTYCGVEIHGFVTYVHDGARGQRGSVLRIVIGDPLRPGFGGWLEERLGKARPSAKEARMVVPFVGLPPLFGRPNDYALQAGAALETSIYLRQRAPEVAERGGVAIPRAELERIADRAGYARRYLGRTVDNLLGAWLTPPAGNPRPAFLELVSPGLYNFGPAHEEAREALAEAGRRTIKGTRQGEATAKGKVGGPRRRRRK